MRSLARLWKEGTPDERRFAQTLLLAYSGGMDVTPEVWQAAERDWRKALRLQDAHGEPDPEFAAMNFLLILVHADRAVRG